MNKKDLVEVVMKSAGLNRLVAEKVVTTILSTIVQSVAQGKTVTIVGFGSFSRAKRSIKHWRHPATGKEGITPATIVPHFKPGSSFRRVLNRQRGGVEMEDILRCLAEMYGDDFHLHHENLAQTKLNLSEESKTSP